jgi:ArsR family metal-binding transcriptional regulator
MADNKPTNAPADEIEVAKEQQQEIMTMGFHDVSDEYPAKKRKRVLMKMDVRIVPLLMLLYCMYPNFSQLWSKHTNSLSLGSALLHRQSKYWKRED